jgi:hypothetical protein
MKTSNRFNKTKKSAFFIDRPPDIKIPLGLRAAQGD